MMTRMLLVPVCLSLFCAELVCQVSGSPFPVGQVVPSVSCESSPKQTYALYLPTSYSAARKWPIIYVFDPAARGQLAVETVRAAAEKFGYIVVASNNSRNGPMGGSGEAAYAVLSDTQQRFPVDERRRYFAGMSGGARVATALAMACDGCAAGVIANAAGFEPSALPKMRFAYFAGVGDADFNYPEFIRLRKSLNEAGAQYRIRIFEGEHGWAPPEVWIEALNWMDMRAMNAGVLARDEGRIAETMERELERARELSSRNDLLAAFRQYETVVRGFDGLSDVSPVKSQLAELSKNKALRKAEKNEADAAYDQAQLTAEASAQLQAIAGGGLSPAAYTELHDTISDLSHKAKAARPNDPKALVTRRALGQLVVQAYESAQRSMEEKKYEAALQYFDVAGAGSKHPEWAHYQRARAYALMSNQKGMFAELRLAIAQGLDDISTLDADEFHAYRTQPEFQALMSQVKAKTRP
jgi:dienelactone hydrolase